jgi:molybdopterin converting factor small subunit
MAEAAPDLSASGTGHVTVRYWAAARAAAGVESDRFDVGEDGTTLDLLVKQVRERHADRPKLAGVVAVCSVLVGDRPVGAHDPAEVTVRPGETVELLPPFAGG